MSGPSCDIHGPHEHVEVRRYRGVGHLLTAAPAGQDREGLAARIMGIPTFGLPDAIVFRDKVLALLSSEAASPAGRELGTLRDRCVHSPRCMTLAEHDERIAARAKCGICNADWHTQREHAAISEAASPAGEGLDAILGSLDEDDVMYDHPVSMTGEPMDPVLFVRWDALAARLAAPDDREGQK